MNAARQHISFAELVGLIGDRYGTFDVPCPLCGPYRSTVAKRRLKVLRIWRDQADFARFHCAHCEAKGWAADNAGGAAKRPSPEEAEKIKAEILIREAQHERDRRLTALKLWQRRQPTAGTLAETYLKEARGYRGTIPATIGFLPASGPYAPAMITAIGVAYEREVGVLFMSDAEIRGVHITALKPDGSGKAGTERDKIVIGKCLGSPIVLAPTNDGLGLAIAEGIEDALSVHEATGLGAWAAGSASRLPALASAIPVYIECVTIIADADTAGISNSRKLAAALKRHPCEVRLVIPPQEESSAA